MVDKLLVFRCPFHGLESGALCWRAFQEENKDKWAWFVPGQEPVEIKDIKSCLMSGQGANVPSWLREEGEGEKWGRD